MSIEWRSINEVTAAAVNKGNGIAALIAGSVVFADTNGHLGQDNSNFFWDQVNKRLGIGTNTPTGCVHVDQGNTIIPSFKGTLNAAANTNIIFLQQLNAGGNGLDPSSLIFVNNQSANSTLVFQNAGVTQFRMGVNGDFFAAGMMTAGNGFSANGAPGITTTITSASLVGKTITVTNGIITGFV